MVSRIAAMLRASVFVFSKKLSKLWSNAHWITASAAAAPLASVSGRSRSPRWTGVFC